MAPEEMIWAAPADRAAASTRGVTCAAKGRRIARWISALPHDLVRPVPGYCWPGFPGCPGRRCGSGGAAARCDERACAVSGGGGFEPTIGRADGVLGERPCVCMLCQAYLAQFRGDAEATTAFASSALAMVGQGERSLGLCDPAVPGHHSMAPWPPPSSAFVTRITPVEGLARARLWRPGMSMNSARSSAVKAAWIRPRGPGAGAGLRRNPRPGCPGLLWAPRMWAWLKWPTSATTSTSPSATSPRALPCDASSLYPAAGRGAGGTGVDPAGQRRRGRGLDGDRRGRAGLAGPARPV